MIKTGFDSDKYLTMQSKKISERIEEFGGKLYLEFGGKLFDDLHASRVLPGFAPDNKIVMLQQLKDKAEIVITINAVDIAKNKLRADLGITYDDDVLRLIDVFRSKGLYVGSVVISQFSKDNQPAIAFSKKLERLNLKVYRHYTIKGYPNNISLIVSDEGYGKNDYIETSRQLIVVTAPGPCSGKMATCLSQLYHEYKRGIKAGYAKYETFPIWNLPLNHPVNIAYEAATADLNDVNMLDPWHFAAYNEKVVNYNRDVEIFPVLNLLFEKIMGKSPYKSPTDMGVNMAGYCISDDELCQDASKQEIIRRYFKARVGERQYISGSNETQKIMLTMDKLGLSPNDRAVVPMAASCAQRSGTPSAALQLIDGRIITGKTTDLMGCSSTVLLNSLKALANIDDSVKLISPSAIEPIQELKTRFLGSLNPRLHTDEVLIALSISAATDSKAKAAMAQLKNLEGCEIHTTTILGSVDEKVFRCLGLNVTSEPVYSTKKLYHK
ncbi:MAG TPA: DUF1846 domain-containing protein [Clostridia bacterium]|nr:DUF1846 domain-containing protein [Clostridia bacterium]